MNEEPHPTQSDEDPDAGSIDEALQADAAGGVVADTTSLPEEQADRRLALDNTEANSLAAKRRPTVLVLAGQPYSGKTSVFAAIYERLGRGPFAGRLFAGSQTIAGFEARCHHWRTSSGLTVPQMEHTRAEDLPWLHLRLRDQELEQPAQDFLFGDFDGEFFRQLTRNEAQPSELPFLHRADHIGVVVDGAQIADAAEQEGELASLEYLADSLIKDPDSVSSAALAMVITKLDVIEASEDPSDRRRISDALDRAREILSQRTGRDVPEVRLAVRSATDRFPLGHGLESLLELLDVRPALTYANRPPALPQGDPLTRFVA